MPVRVMRFWKHRRTNWKSPQEKLAPLIPTSLSLDWTDGKSFSLLPPQETGLLSVETEAGNLQTWGLGKVDWIN